MRLKLGLRRRLAHGRALVEGAVAQIAPQPMALAPGAHRLAPERWFLSRAEARELVRRWPAAPLLREADDCVRHEFEVLGTGLDSSGGALPWHRDIRSGHTWPRRYYKALRHRLSGNDGRDVKVPWELSRFQHLLPLVKAYCLTGDSRLPAAAAGDLSDWMAENPYRYGVNWTSAMEVAIRACNWLWAYWAFGGHPSWSSDFEDALVQSLWHHALHIERNLEDDGGIRTNHYLANIVGLLFLAVMLPTLPGSASRAAFARAELERCMTEMVYADGVSFENSVAYHRLVLELLTASALLCRRNQLPLTGAFWAHLERMFEFVQGCMRPDGWMPMIGDADDGRLFALEGFVDWDRWDFRYLLSVGAVLYRRADFKHAAGRRHGATDWLLGAEVATWDTL